MSWLEGTDLAYISEELRAGAEQATSYAHGFGRADVFLASYPEAAQAAAEEWALTAHDVYPAPDDVLEEIEDEFHQAAEAAFELGLFTQAEAAHYARLCRGGK